MFQPIEGADGGHHMGRIGALATTRFDQIEIFEAVEQRVQGAKLLPVPTQRNFST
jgi:hypothetical protein